MLRYTEKEDFEARFGQVDGAVEKWREVTVEVSEQLRGEFNNKLMISLIYHDAALEGEVLTHSEIKAAIDTNIISDTSLIPQYDEIKNFHTACRHAEAIATARRKSLKLDAVKELHALLDPDAGGAANYRKENPLHRLYYHDIAPPEKIPYRMRKLGEWLEGNNPKQLHPIERAAETHWRLMSVFPWAKHSGQVSRIVGNLLLRQADHPLAVIHSIDRQRYYEALKADDSKSLLSLYLEAVETTAQSALRVYEEALRGRRAS